jgi:hypothetical protein
MNDIFDSGDGLVTRYEGQDINNLWYLLIKIGGSAWESNAYTVFQPIYFTE